MAFTHTVLSANGNRAQVQFQNEQGEIYTRTMYLIDGSVDSPAFLEQIEMQKTIIETRVANGIISLVTPG